MPQADVPQAEAPQVETPDAVGYPRARWRLTNPRQLESVVLWVSHILIRHEGSDRRVPGTVHDWRLEAPPQRSREDALALARDLAKQAERTPERFAELARSHSEDPTSRALGGSLGGVRAVDLVLTPELLDALSGLQPGRVSHLIETRQGFEILYRRPPPAEARVGGAHLVIGHEDAAWLGAVGVDVPHRTRAEALQLAAQIRVEAAAHPERFAELVRRLSDHPDKTRDGALGTWSAREPTPVPRQVEVLQQLTIGEVSGVFETHFGVEIVLRTPEAPRVEYAMEAIRLPFRPGNDAEKRSASQLADTLLQQLGRDPSRFDALRAEHCCSGAERWLEGRDEPGLSAAVSSLQMGEVSRRAVMQFQDIVIPRRIDPAALPPEPEVRFELPSPEKADLRWVMPRLPRRIVAGELAAIVREQRGVFSLDPAQSALLEELSRDVRQARSSNPSDLPPEQFFVSVEALLDGEPTGTLRSLLEYRLGEIALAARRRPSESMPM